MADTTITAEPPAPAVRRARCQRLPGRPLVSEAYLRRTGGLRHEPLVSESYLRRTGRLTHSLAAPASTGPVPPAVEDERWRSRPALALIVRMAAFAVPIGASVVAAVAFGRLIPRPSGWAVVGWWLTVTALATVVLVAVDQLARRHLLPLAALLKLSMAFPDRAPCRFAVAFRAGWLGNLREQVAHAREHGIDEDPTRGAAKILALLGALNAHDRRTRGHCERVRAFNDLLADELGLSEHDRDRLRWAALLHDVGKLNVSHRVLNKPGKPTDAEWAELEAHPVHGARLAAPLRAWLGPWSETIEQHHEHWDGTGYPHGLMGEQISLGGRIVAVADAFEVMTAPRPYRRPVSAQSARAELARHAGVQFDSAVVRAFLNISIGDLRRVMGPLSWLAQLPFVGAIPQLQGATVAAGRQGVVAAGAATGVGAVVVASLVTGDGGQRAEAATGPAAAKVDADVRMAPSPANGPGATVLSASLGSPVVEDLVDRTAPSMGLRPTTPAGGKASAAPPSSSTGTTSPSPGSKEATRGSPPPPSEPAPSEQPPSPPPAEGPRPPGPSEGVILPPGPPVDVPPTPALGWGRDNGYGPPPHAGQPGPPPHAGVPGPPPHAHGNRPGD